MTRPSQPGDWGVPRWWPAVVSAWGMAAATFSSPLHLSEGLYPIIALAIVTGPSAWGDRILRRRGEKDDEQ